MTTNHFFRELLRQAGLSNINYANTEEEYASINVEIISRELEVSGDLPRENRDYLLQQLHLNKIDGFPVDSKLMARYIINTDIDDHNNHSLTTFRTPF